MNTVKNYGCITVLLLGAAGFVFSIVRHRWGSGNPIEESVEYILLASAITLGGLWLTIFPKDAVMANVRMGDVIFHNRKKAEQRVPVAVFSNRLGGILATLVGILMLIINIQDLLVLLGIVKNP